MLAHRLFSFSFYTYIIPHFYLFVNSFCTTIQTFHGFFFFVGHLFELFLIVSRASRRNQAKNRQKTHKKRTKTHKKRTAAAAAPSRFAQQAEPPPPKIRHTKASKRASASHPSKQKQQKGECERFSAKRRPLHRNLQRGCAKRRPLHRNLRRIFGGGGSYLYRRVRAL